MFGALLKSYYAGKINVDKEKIVVVSVMPCIAKKFECSRPEMEVDGVRDVVECHLEPSLLYVHQHGQQPVVPARPSGA